MNPTICLLLRRDSFRNRIAYPFMVLQVRALMVFCIVGVLTTAPVWGQQFSKGWKAGKNTTGEAITTDRGGNVYVAGHFAGPITFGSTTLTGPTDRQSVYIAKYNKDGVLQGVFRATGIATGSDYSYVAGIAVDFDGQM